VSRITLAAIRGVVSPSAHPAALGLIPTYPPQIVHMKKYTARVGNIYFLSHIGPSLRWATEDTVRDELPTNIKELLTQLDQLEGRIRVRNRRPDNKF
jgi:hypothetical protein